MATGLFLSIYLFYAWGPANSPIASAVAMIAPFIVVPLVSLFTNLRMPNCSKKRLIRSERVYMPNDFNDDNFLEMIISSIAERYLSRTKNTAGYDQ